METAAAATAASGGGMTSFGSILNKPLTQLTEEDISQLTREDCRKYLKEKGMRRPSWNKSQAIQQVISLKTLLETTSDDSGAGALRRFLVSKPPPPPPPPGSDLDTPSSAAAAANSSKELSVEPNASSVSVSQDETFPCRRNDSPPKTIFRAVKPPDCRLEEAAPAPDDKSSAPRSLAVASGSAGQMTIFYCGKVNVYDGMPPDKAWAIMHLAASPVQLSHNDLPANVAFSNPSPRQIQGDKSDLFPQGGAISPTTQTDVEGQASRKVSLQRYLEKRRDRGRFKGRKTFGTPCSNLEMFLKHHNRTYTTSGHLMMSSTGSPLQPRANNQEKIANFSVDLNEDTQEF